MFAESRNVIIPHHFGNFLHCILFRFQQHSRTAHTYSSDQFYNGIVCTLLHFAVKGGLTHIHFRCQFLHTEVRLANIFFHNFDNSCDKRIFRLHFLIRYADILLLYAECLNDEGNSKEAIKYINKVRDRVHVTPLSDTLSKEQVLKHLQDVERPCELALEGSRWYDLIRWGIVEDALKSHEKPFASNFISTKHIRLAIPHKEFLMNPDWVQNEGYTK